MQGYIKDGWVYKTGAVPKCVLHTEAFPQVSLIHAYKYEFIEGRRASFNDVPRVLAFANDKLWSHERTSIQQLHPSAVKGYVDYVKGRAYGCDFENSHCVKWACDLISRYAMEKADYVHGDLTLENVIVTPEGRMIFIDPGSHYGCETPYLDRGKLLQSVVMRWEEKAWHAPNDVPSWATELDVAFLVTHWVRLQRHWKALPVADGFVTLEKIVRNI